MSEERAERCERCRFWDLRGFDLDMEQRPLGICRRYPPALDLNLRNQIDQQPTTGPDDWCGEFLDKRFS